MRVSTTNASGVNFVFILITGRHALAELTHEPTDVVMLGIEVGDAGQHRRTSGMASRAGLTSTVPTGNGRAAGEIKLLALGVVSVSRMAS